MDIGWIEDFLALAKWRNFSRAAACRNITQPAFSRRIRMVEDWAGAELIDRSLHHFSLTDAGERFVQQAPDILLRLEALRRDCSGTGHVITMIATHALASSFVNAWLASLELGLRDYTLQAAEIGTCATSVASGAADFMIVPEVIETGPFPAVRNLKVTIGSDALTLVSGLDIAGDVERLGVTEALRGRLATYGVASPFQSLIADRMKSLSLHEADIISPLVAVLKSMALTGRCAAFLPASCLQAEFTSGALVRLEDARADISYDIALYRRFAQLSPKAEKLWQSLIKAHLGNAPKHCANGSI